MAAEARYVPAFVCSFRERVLWLVRAMGDGPLYLPWPRDAVFPINASDAVAGQLGFVRHAHGLIYPALVSYFANAANLPYYIFSFLLYFLFFFLDVRV